MYATDNKQIVLDHEPYVGLGGIQYTADWPKDSIPDLHKVIETPRPNDASIVVTGYSINDTYTQIWSTRLKTAEEVEADRVVGIMEQICALEGKITNRMREEAAIDSMLTGLGEDGSLTAKQFITSVRAQIAVLRSSL